MVKSGIFKTNRTFSGRHAAKNSRFGPESGNFQALGKLSNIGETVMHLQNLMTQEMDDCYYIFEQKQEVTKISQKEEV